MNASELHTILVYISPLWKYSDLDLQMQLEKERERESEKLTHQNCYHQSLGHRHLFVKEEYGWCLSKSLKILEKTTFFPPSDLQLGLRALQCSEEGMILQTNIYENDKLLLDCFKNFYNSEKRAIAIYRLLKVKMGSCNTGLYSTFPPVIFLLHKSVWETTVSLTQCLWMVIQHLFA